LGAASASIHRQRAEALTRLKRWDAALVAYDAAVARYTGNVELHAGRAAVLNELRRWEQALASCDLVINIAPDFASAHGSRGNALRAMGRFEEALHNNCHIILSVCSFSTQMKIMLTP